MYCTRGSFTCSDDPSADLRVGSALRGIRTLGVALPEKCQAETRVFYLGEEEEADESMTHNKVSSRTRCRKETSSPCSYIWVFLCIPPSSSSSTTYISFGVTLKQRNSSNNLIQQDNCHHIMIRCETITTVATLEEAFLSVAQYEKTMKKMGFQGL